jgi:hypothetical protein
VRERVEADDERYLCRPEASASMTTTVEMPLLKSDPAPLMRGPGEETEADEAEGELEDEFGEEELEDDEFEDEDDEWDDEDDEEEWDDLDEEEELDGDLEDEE